MNMAVLEHQLSGQTDADAEYKQLHVQNLLGFYRQ